MTQDISNFDPKEVIKSVFEDLKGPFETELQLRDALIDEVSITNSSLTYYAPRVANGIYNEIPYKSVLDEVNELLASHTFSSTESSYWPIVFHHKNKERRIDLVEDLDAQFLPVLQYEGKKANGTHDQKHHPRKVTYKIEPSNIILVSDNSTPYKAGDKLAMDYFKPPVNRNISPLQKIKVTYTNEWVSSTGSLGAGRCDSVDEVDYVWMGNKELGVALGLDPKNVTVWSLIKNTEQPVVGYLPALESKPTMNEFINRVVDLLETKDFFLANFPEDSEILYFKRFRQGQVERKNHPRDPSPQVYIPFKFKNAFGVYEYQFAARKKKKEKQIAINAELRESAATKMLKALAPFTDDVRYNSFEFKFFKNHQSQRGSAKLFAQAIISPKIRLDFDQEWCHLLGHGDSGAEEPSNFISGSKHCNSEQLAIEEGQRIWSNSKDVSLQANITTYIEPISHNHKDQSLEEAIICLLRKTVCGPFNSETTNIAKLLVKQNFFELNISDPNHNLMFVNLVAREDFGETYNNLVKEPNDSGFTSMEEKKRERILNFLEHYLVKKILDKVLEHVGNGDTPMLDSGPTFEEIDTEEIAKVIGNKGLLREYKTKNHGSTLSFPEEFSDRYSAIKEEVKNKDISIPWKTILEVIEESYLKNFYPKYMRYKIKLKNDKWIRIFNHVYDAQSESFDYHEFKILRTTVDRLIAEALRKTGKYEERIQKKSENYNIGNIRFCRDNKGGVEVKIVKVEDVNAMEIVK